MYISSIRSISTLQVASSTPVKRHALEAQFPLTVQDVVSMGCWPRVSLFSGFRRETRSRIASALERVGLDAMALSTIDALSGGQFQRMLFARILVQQAPLVMLDEPFTGVDEATCKYSING